MDAGRLDWYKRIGFHLDTRFMIVREKRDGRWEMGEGGGS